MNEKILMAHFNLVAEAIGECFTKPKNCQTALDFKRVKETRIKFANSQLVKMWCDCSNNFEYEKLKKRILNANL